MNNDKRIYYWLWLQSALGAGSSKIRIINEELGSPADFYKLGYNNWCDMRLFTQRELYALKSRSPEQSQQIIDECRRLEYDIITPDSPNFPKRLLNIPDYPAALYVWGELDGIDDEVAIAVVGTRSCSPYGQRVAVSLAYSLAKSGAVIVSGGALGVDTCAHKGALMGRGKTVCVLGCGINTRYLSENISLREAISQNGAVISEYPPGTPARAGNFPRRNRLMSGLSLGTVVAEAALRSGSLITAKLAADQGRDVFAIPGSVLSEYSKGCNRLIAEGAKPVLCANDVLEEYINQYPHKITITSLGVKSIVEQGQGQSEPSSENAQLRLQTQPQNYSANTSEIKKQPESKPISNTNAGVRLTDSLSDEAKRVYSVMTQEKMHIDNIAALSGLDVMQTSASLMELELNRLIKSYPAQYFGLIK